MNMRQMGESKEFIINKEMDIFFEEKGYKKSTMESRIFNRNFFRSNREKQICECFERTFKDPENKRNQMKIMLNEKEAYLEVVTPEGKMVRFCHFNIKGPMTMERAEDIINKLKN